MSVAGTAPVEARIAGVRTETPRGHDHFPRA
jgi:hypothetical protein